MDRAKAIELITSHLRQCAMLMPVEWVEKNGSGELMDAFELAFDALREQEQREQECGGCRGAVHTDELFEVTNPHGVKVDVQFNFCPVCGRKLGGAEE